MVVNVASPLSAADQRRLVTDWFEAYQAPLYRYLTRLVGDPESAADLLQDTFMRALTALGHQAPPDNPSAWLYRIATNLAYSVLRRRRRLRWLPLLGAESAPAFEEGVADAQAIRRCLAQLRPKEAEVILLSLYAGLTSVEIGALTGENATTIRVRLSRACKRFETLYAKENA
jgi:RNA polymerase sigma-70 factor (ECF subfamily)